MTRPQVHRLIIAALSVAILLAKVAPASATPAAFNLEITTFKGEEIESMALRAREGQCEIKSESNSWVSIEKSKCDRASALAEKVAKVETTAMTPHESHLRISFESGGKDWIKQTPLRLVKSCDRNGVCTESGGVPSPAMKQLADLVAGFLKK